MGKMWEAQTSALAAIHKFTSLRLFICKEILIREKEHKV